jgi:hypothetical protein
LVLFSWVTHCRLDGVVISVLATGPKDSGFKPGRGDKIPQHTFLRMGIKPEIPCRKILRHVKDPLRYLRYWVGKMFISYTFLCSLQMVWLPLSSGRQVRKLSPAGIITTMAVHSHPPGGWRIRQWWPRFLYVSLASS